MFKLRRTFQSLIAACLLCIAAPSVIAQTQPIADELASDTDRGIIVELLEDALGGEGRIVRVNGFAGALSRTATIAQMTIADENGTWLTLEDVRLRWNRAALLRGRIEIEELSAQTLQVERAPIAPETDVPAEAQGFALPQLPVSVAIDVLKIDSISLGRAILGEAAEFDLAATATLADGSGSIELTSERLDGQEGAFVIDASYEKTTNIAVIALDLSEGEGGIVARALNLPERPAVQLNVAGEGSIDDLVTTISLSTNGVRRLTGQVTLKGSEDDGRNFEVDLGGDLRPLLDAQYHEFFGEDAQLQATARQSPEGALELSNLDLSTESLRLIGAAALDKDYAPVRLALTGFIEGNGGASVVLPINNGATQIEKAELRLRYNSDISDRLNATFDIDTFETDGVAAASAQLNVEGELASLLGVERTLQADVGFRAQGVKFDEQAQQQAFGDTLDGRLRLGYRASGELDLDDLDISGTGFTLKGALAISGLEDAFETEVDLVLTAQRLSQFSELIGTDIRGQAELGLKGAVDLGGVFDLDISGLTQDVGIGVEQLDKVLAGRSVLESNVVRDENGLRVPRFSVANAQIKATGAANLQTDNSEATFDAVLANSAQIDPRLSGPISFQGDATQDAIGWSVDANLTGPFNATSQLSGRATGPNPALKFSVALPDVQPITPQFRGALNIDGTAALTSGAWDVQTNLRGPYGISGAVDGVLAGPTPSLDYRLSIPNIASLGAQLDGSLTIDGSAVQRQSGWRIDTDISGLSGAQAQINGQVLQSGSLDLTARGVAPLALANPFLAPRNVQGQGTFDLAVRGRPVLSSVSGTITTANARVSAPTLRISFAEVAANIGLNAGRAVIDASAAVSSGGHISARGPVALSGNLAADLAIGLNAVRLVDPALYETRLDGQLGINGPLTGGALISGGIDVGETNIRVPEPKKAGFTIVPSIVHRNPTPSVRQTLRRAGFDANPSGSDATTGSAPAFDLNILINAPTRIFVRGRGLDAELGGSLRLTGRTDQLISAGRFELIRGRFDVLGKRFTLDEGQITLQGAFDPYIRLVTSTRTNTGTASIIIEGLASDPVVRFTSVPEAPQDEVLAQIFFGRDVSKLSPFQAVQLASAVASLAGKGGEGIVSRLRKSFDLDDIDITTDEEGNTGLRLGKYISDNVYTEVTVGDENTAGISINIDLSKSITARGQVKTDGNSSVGIFFEKDY